MDQVEEPAGRFFKGAVAAFTTVVPLIIAFLSFREAAMIGFPDGHVTEFERADRIALALVVTANIVIAILSCWVFLRKRPARFFVFLTVGFIVVHGAYFASRTVMSHNLDHGRGG